MGIKTVLILFLVFSALANSEARKRRHKRNAATGTVIPLYLYPQVINGVHNWQPLINAHNSHPTVEVWAIVNVFNGPSNPIDPNYVDAIGKLKTAGIRTLGYVSTNYTRVSATKAKEDVDTWKSFYNPDGIFFDEMSSEFTSDAVQYYTDLGNYVKSKGFTRTVGNPGTDVASQFAGTLDTIMIVEDDRGFPDQSRICGWHQNYPRTQWGIFPYNIATLNEAQILAAKQCVGYIYVTHDGGNNPWDELPPYLNQLFEILSRS
jgi:hypothetical protein